MGHVRSCNNRLDLCASLNVARCVSSNRSTTTRRTTDKEGTREALNARKKDPAPPLTEEAMRKIFDKFDGDGSGNIDAAELNEAMMGLGKRMTATELNRMVREADTNGDGTIDFEEFVGIMKAAEKGDPSLSNWAVLGVST